MSPLPHTKSSLGSTLFNSRKGSREFMSQGKEIVGRNDMALAAKLKASTCACSLQRQALRLNVSGLKDSRAA